MPLNVNQIQETKNERNKFCLVVIALQCYQLKAAVSPFSNLIIYILCSDPHIKQAFAASSKACLFRMHYDTPGFLENIEPRFKWVDPAEVSWLQISCDTFCNLT